MNVSCIIRFHDINKMPYLERAIHSLHSQTGVSVKPIVVLQRFSDEDASLVSEMLGKHWYFDEHQAPAVLNLVDDSTADARSKLLNLGIECHSKSGNRFMGFLDYDDFLYSHAYSVLTDAINSKKVSIAFASVEVAGAVPFKDYDFIYQMTRPFSGSNKIDLMRDNFCPLHSYLVDTTATGKEPLFFREDMSRVEDYEFLIRIAGSNPCDFSNLGTYIGCYVMRSDGSNTTPSGSDSQQEKEKVSIWARNAKLLHRYKSNTEVRFFASDF